MSDRADADLRAVVRAAAGSPQLAQALATISVGLAAAVFPLQRLLGWGGLFGAMAALLLLMVVSFAARRTETDWRGILPISLLVYLSWAAISVAWSQYQWATVGGLLYLIAFTAMGLYVALLRDTIQIVRVFGNVLRLMLALSLIIEIFSGILIDAPIPLFSVQGQLDVGGPISGIVATRNQLGLLAIIGATSFVTEHRTRSVPRLVSISSLVVAVVVIAFTQSPVVLGTSLVVGIAAALLYALRRVPPDRRRFWQLVVLGLAVIGSVIAWLMRSLIVETFNATGALTYRLELWNKIFDLVRLNYLQGWGWIGRWRGEIVPFSELTTSSARPAQSALNSYLDLWFQLGLIGLVLFIGMLGLAFVRSWLLAGRRRSVVYAWPAVVLVALLVLSLAESTIVAEFGWMTFVICCLKASQELSWRRAFTAAESS